MKKIISILLILCLSVTVFSACEDSDNETEEIVTDTTTEVAPIEEKEEIVEEVQEAPEPEPVINKVDINWTDYTYTMTDSDGYTYELTYKLSPWISLSNSEYINAAWSEVGKNKILPQFDDWGLKKSSDGSQVRIGVPRGGFSHNFVCRMTDMYYCIGSAQIKNVTDGWDISSSSPRSVTVNIWNYGKKESISRIFYSNETRDQANNVMISAHMESNTWGRVPFIIMTPENFSPNNPEGEYKEAILKGSLSFTGGDKQVRIGIIDKDGVYTPPILPAE